MTDVNLKQQFRDFISRLPLAESEKSRLAGILESEDGINKARAELESVLKLARDALQAAVDKQADRLDVAQKAFDEAERQFKDQVSLIEADAKDLVRAINKASDEEALEEARKKIA